MTVSLKLNKLYSTKLVGLDYYLNEMINLYEAKKYPNVEFTCADYNKDMIESGKEIAESNNISNIKYKYIDVFDIDKNNVNGQYDGVISLQTLSFLSEFKCLKL